MRAIVQDKYGSTDQLHLRDVPEPTPGAGKVRVRVRAAGSQGSSTRSARESRASPWAMRSSEQEEAPAPS